MNAMEINLPNNFQEILMQSELEFKKGINNTTLKKMIYLYTLGMQYYDVAGKSEYQEYYHEKLNSLYSNPSVINYLEGNQFNMPSSQNEIKNLFPNFDTKSFQNVTNENLEITGSVSNVKSKENDRRSTLKNIIRSFDLNKDNNIQNNNVNNPPVYRKKKKIKISEEELLAYIKKKIDQVESKLKVIDEKVANCVVDEMTTFNDQKKTKPVRKIQRRQTIKRGSMFSLAGLESLGFDMNMLQNNQTPKKEQSRKESANESGHQGPESPKSKSDEEDDEDRELELFAQLAKDNIPAKRRGSSIGQSRMLKEIEEYVEANMKEMNQAKEELKQSYEGEIKEAEESGIQEIADGLKEDLESELEQLGMQYEEERLKQIEIIKARYNAK